MKKSSKTLLKKRAQVQGITTIAVKDHPKDFPRGSRFFPVSHLIPSSKSMNGRIRVPIPKLPRTRYIPMYAPRLPPSLIACSPSRAAPEVTYTKSSDPVKSDEKMLIKKKRDRPNVKMPTVDLTLSSFHLSRRFNFFMSRSRSEIFFLLSASFFL